MCKKSPKVLALFLLFLAQVSCATDADKPLVEPQYRLQEDRKAFEDIRKEVPADVQDQNDELAFVEKLFEDPLKNPHQIRDKFQKALAKKRDKFHKDLQKKRNEFVRSERKSRDEFNKNMVHEREKFKTRKPTRDESKAFFDELEQRRKDFNSSQKEKRDEFEEEIRDQRKNFEDYSREKQNDFAARLKDFSLRQKEIQKKPVSN